MAQCPACEFTLSEDFGVVTCPSCGTVSVIDIDGQARANAPREGVDEAEGHYDSDRAQNRDTEVAAPEVSVENLSQQPWEDPMSDIEFDDPLPVTSAPPAAPTEANFAESIEEFGNADNTAGLEGSLKYNVVIEGIDSFDIRQEIKEALTDKKFIWDIDSLLRSITEGRLEIRDLSAVKASVLVDRLKYLPIKISWEQHAIFDP